MFVRLLGAVGAGPDEHFISDAPGRIAAAVLAHLVLARGHLVTTETLALAVWDEPPETARNSIQVAISKLRKAYGSDLVSTDRDGYRISPAFLRVDLIEVEHLVRDARVALDDGRPGQALELTRAALVLFVGETMAGLDAASVLSVRQQVRELHTSALLLSGNALLRLGRPEEAASLVQEHVGQNPLDEPAHALLMESLSGAGRPAEAMNIFDGLRRRLADELGMDPSPVVTELFQRLLNEGRPPPTRPVGPRASERTVRLPAEGSPLIGRDEDLRRISALFASGHRLVTLLGTGGIGKTRLAVAAARRIAKDQEAPAFFIDLTQARHPSEVRSTVATTVEASGPDFVAGLQGTRALVILDNAEHVLDAAADAANALLAIEGLQVLTTSRSPLKLRDEQCLWLNVLPNGSPDDPALRLLVDRSGLSSTEVLAQRANLQALARRADGIPLVLELLASALRWETADELLTHLEDSLLGAEDGVRDRPDRHVNAKTAIDWSLHQSSIEARTGLGALTVLRGSFGLDVALEILSAVLSPQRARRTLAELVDISLVMRLAERGEIRFRILEPIRLAAEQSEVIPEATFTAHQAHAAYYLRGLDRDVRATADQAQSDDPALRKDESNLRSALEWSWENDPQTALTAVNPLLASLRRPR